MYNEYKKIVLTSSLCTAFLLSMPFTTFAASPSYIQSASLEEKVIAETDEYIITWVPEKAVSMSSKASNTYTVKNWSISGGKTAYGRMFDIEANNTIYIDYDISWDKNANVSVGTYSSSSGFKTAISVTDTESSGSIKVQTRSNPVTLSFAVRNNGTTSITVNGSYQI